MPATLIARIDDRRPVVGRVVRCLAVSVATTGLSVGILVILALGFGVPAGTANAIGVTCGIPASFVGNRRWVWRRSGPSALRREILPFWVMCLLGLVASTAVVGRVGMLTASLPAVWRAVVLPAANAATFGALWVIQFALLDRVIFRARPDPDALPDPARPARDRAARPLRTRR